MADILLGQWQRDAGVVSVVPDQLKDKVTVFGPADPHALLKKMKRHLDRHATFWPPGDNDHVPPPRIVEEPGHGGDPHARGEKHFEQVLANGQSPGPPPGMVPAQPMPMPMPNNVIPNNVIPKVTPGPRVEVVTGPKVEVRTGPRVEVRTHRDPREIDQIERGMREAEIGDRREPREVRQGPPREVVFIPVDAKDGTPVDPRDVRVAEPREIRGDPREYAPKSPRGGDPREYAPRSPRGGDPREFAPRSPRGGDPREYAPRSPRGADLREFAPRSPRGMPPPGAMLPVTRPPEIRVRDPREYQPVDPRPYGPKSPRGGLIPSEDLRLPVPPREIRVNPRDQYPREREGMRRPDPRDYRTQDPREVEGMRRLDTQDYRSVDPREVEGLRRPDPRDFRTVDPRDAREFEFRGADPRDYAPKSPRGMGEPMMPVPPRGYGPESEPRGGLRPAEPRILLDVTKDLAREGENHGRDNLYPPRSPRGMGAVDPRMPVDPRDDPRDYRTQPGYPRPHVSQYSEFRSTEADPRVYQPKDSYFSDYLPSQSYNPGPLATQSLEDQPVTNPNYLKHII